MAEALAIKQGWGIQLEQGWKKIRVEGSGL